MRKAAWDYATSISDYKYEQRLNVLFSSLLETPNQTRRQKIGNEINKKIISLTELKVKIS